MDLQTGLPRDGADQHRLDEVIAALQTIAQVIQVTGLSGSPTC